MKKIANRMAAKSNIKCIAGLALAGLLSTGGVLAGFGFGIEPDPNLSELAVQDLAALHDDTLDDLRGGFISSENIKITFGYESVFKVDGVLQASTSLNFTDLNLNTRTGSVSVGNVSAQNFIAKVMAEGISFSSGNMTTGSGGLELASSLMRSATKITNTVDNRTIQYIQDFQLKVEGLDVGYNKGTYRNLTPALIQSLR